MVENILDHGAVIVTIILIYVDIVTRTVLWILQLYYCMFTKSTYIFALYCG